MGVDPLAWTILLNQPASLLKILVEYLSGPQTLLYKLDVLGKRDCLSFVHSLFILVVVSAELLGTPTHNFFPSVVIEDVQKGFFLLFSNKIFQQEESLDHLMLLHLVLQVCLISFLVLVSFHLG